MEQSTLRASVREAHRESPGLCRPADWTGDSRSRVRHHAAATGHANSRRANRFRLWRGLYPRPHERGVGRVSRSRKAPIDEPSGLTPSMPAPPKGIGRSTDRSSSTREVFATATNAVTTTDEAASVPRAGARRSRPYGRPAKTRSFRRFGASSSQAGTQKASRTAGRCCFRAPAGGALHQPP